MHPTIHLILFIVLMYLSVVVPLVLRSTVPSHTLVWIRYFQKCSIMLKFRLFRDQVLVLMFQLLLKPEIL